MRTMIATFLMAATLAVVPVTAHADTVIQNQNHSQDAEAYSGDAEASNDAEVHSGPQASSAGGSAQAQQMGDNSTEVDQSSRARSGDAVAGSQVTAVRGGGDTTIQNQNFSDGVFAASGDAFAANSAVVSSGPVADSLFGPASSSQIGANAVVLDQVVDAETGDAVVGSQITGVL